MVEKIGLVKMDLLGLSTLEVIKECEDMTGIKARDIPLNYKKTWKYIQEAKFMKNVFQLSEPKTCKYLRDSKPTNILELSAVNTGIRPGSDWKTYLENKKAKIVKPKYELPIIKEVLKDTYGAILYQDDLLFLINKLSDLNLGEADLLRRAFEKNDAEQINTYKKRFVDTCKYEDIAVELFEWLQSSVGYLFAKAHAVSYSINGYYTAFFKANYPEVFLTANILHPKSNNKQSETEYIYDFIKEAREMGIKIELPKLGNCYEKPTLVGKVIYYGISSIKGVGDVAAPILASIEAASFEEFVEKAQSVKGSNKNGQKTTPVNKGHILRLVKIGFFGDVKTHIEKYNTYFKEEEDPNVDSQDAVNDALDMAWYDPLAKYLNKLPAECHDTDKYLVIKVESEKSGVAKSGNKWRLIKGSSNNGEWSSFNQKLKKGSIYLVKYEKDKDNIKILKERELS
jgi:DNA polymerase III alpha subunit